jgi:hypothetical protein
LKKEGIVSEVMYLIAPSRRFQALRRSARVWTAVESEAIHRPSATFANNDTPRLSRAPESGNFVKGFVTALQTLADVPH